MQPVQASDAVWAPPVQPAPARPAARTGRLWVSVVAIVFTAVVALLVLGYLLVSLGAPAVLVAMLLAFVPLVLVLVAIRWVDRWEPEPRSALWFAFLWGAAVSVAIALLVDAGIRFALATPADTDSVREFVSAVVQAPFVEELAKGLGVLLVYAFWRSQFDGPVDGLVYAATVAAGFAFSENIVYFAVAIAEGANGDLGYTFVVRGIFSPFAHVMFTAATGLGLGIAVRRDAGLVWRFLLGLGIAIALHALWNGALFLVDDVVFYYFTVQLPLFVFAIVLTVLIRRQEIELTRERLEEYADAGWFADSEVVMLATPQGRRRAREWAKRAGKQRAMRGFIADATHLAFTRQRLVSGRPRPGDLADERALLSSVTRSREKLMQ
ncbi:PrsW family intramembrane metalloprotease [Agromyces archimandritae]|uniref:PrsW family intramembrane metalloprotease n=2 Tax=Agromyces archimandritae TaxID=2781962 RepID=A0A975FPW4_9MICO|nr:PrsW family intramembrane metalloprotease [Agromyces archimandritae]